MRTSFRQISNGKNKIAIIIRYYNCKITDERKIIMTVLLIGGAGFVGKTLVEFLARNNYKIIILSRNAQEVIN